MLTLRIIAVDYAFSMSETSIEIRSNMRIRKAILLAITAIALAHLAACGLSGRQRAATKNVLTALKKIQAAVEVGVSYQQYSQLVIEAKAAVNEASSQVPDGELKQELLAAMEAYSDASEGWANSETSNMPLLGRKGILRLKEVLTGKELVGQRLREKYKIKTYGEEFYGENDPNGITGSELDFIMLDDALNAAWKEAQKHLNRASELLG
jgi:hypothetical protein